MNTFAKIGRYRYVATRLAMEAMQKGMTMRACDSFMTRVNVYLSLRQFPAALALMLQMRTKKMPAVFPNTMQHWHALAEIESKEANRRLQRL